MSVNLSMENVLSIVTLIVSGYVALWMRAVTSQNKLFEQKTQLLEKEIHEVKHTNEGLAKSTDAIRAVVQDTRENYVTNVRFEKFTDLMAQKLDHIMGRFDALFEKLDEKPNKEDCKLTCPKRGSHD